MTATIATPMEDFEERGTLRDRSRWINVLGALLFGLGGAALIASLALRGCLARFEVRALVIETGLEGLEPSASARFEGHNPLPLAVTVDDIEVDIGGGGLPVNLNFESDQVLEFDPGDFTESLHLTGETASLDLASTSSELMRLWGGGSRALEDVPWEASALVSVGPLRRRCRFGGTAAAALEGRKR